MKSQHAITTLCQALEVSPSGYYDWEKRTSCPAPRTRQEALLRAQIARIHQDSRQTYGAPTMAFTLMQETLKPVERAVFLLREVFDYDYAATAAIVGKAEANCRQIVRRAKAQLLANATPPPEPNEQARHLAEQFVSVAATGEVKDLLALVKKDGDDGAKAKCRRSTRAHIFCGSARTVTPAAHARRTSRSRASLGSDAPTSRPSDCDTS
jgi:hypothetical protein